MIVRDWRTLPADTVAPLFTAEADTWLDALAWDSRTTWRALEQGRRTGHVWGFVATDADQHVRGWCYGGRHGAIMHVGGMVTDTPEATAALLDATSDVREANLVTEWRWFGWFRAPGLEEALANAGAQLTTYRYLSASRPAAQPAAIPAPEGTTLRTWRTSDAAKLSGVLASAYPGPGHTRPFAPQGTPDEWHEYAFQLLTMDGCGVFTPSLSFVMENAGGAVTGAAVVTRLSHDTAHLAQLAVAADTHGRGRGRALLTAVEAGVWAAGFRRITLLVADDNAAAMRLYRQAGFVEMAAFTAAQQNAAGMRQPRTLRNEALATGGVSTRR